METIFFFTVVHAEVYMRNLHEELFNLHTTVPFFVFVSKLNFKQCDNSSLHRVFFIPCRQLYCECNGHSSKAVNRDQGKTNWPTHTCMHVHTHRHTQACTDKHACVLSQTHLDMKASCTYTFSTMQKKLTLTFTHIVVHLHNKAHTHTHKHRVISLTLLVVVYRSQFQVSAQSQGS